MCQTKVCVQRLEATNFVIHELKTDAIIGYIQRFGAWRSGGFRSTKLSIHHKS